MSIAVAVVEDSRAIRESLQRIITDTPGLTCAWAVASGEEALAEAVKNRADVVLMDIHLPNMSGIECTARLKALVPEVEVMMLTVYGDQEKIFKALQAGACGYLLKRTPPEQIIQAIRDLRQGGAPMNSEIARRLVETLQRPATNSGLKIELSRREKEVLDLISRGYGNKEVADQLSVSYETVRHHLKAVYEKLHVHSRTEAVIKFLGLEGRPDGKPAPRP